MMSSIISARTQKSTLFKISCIFQTLNFNLYCVKHILALLRLMALRNERPHFIYCPTPPDILSFILLS